MKILSDFAVDKLTWIQTLKDKHQRISEIFKMFDYRIRARGCRAGESLHAKNSSALTKDIKITESLLEKVKCSGEVTIKANNLSILQMYK